MNAIATENLGKRYGRRWALQHCTLAIPVGSVAGLVGTNGAGKTTLLRLAVGLLEPSEGSLTVLGNQRETGPGALARTGFLAQDAPVYSSLTVAEHLRLGAHLNPRWDDGFARRRIAALGLDPGHRAGRLSGGQRSQLALTLAMAKRPDLLVLDEPVSSLDPLARREFLRDLMELVTEHEPTVVLSSHSLADVERVCDFLVVLADGQVRLAGRVDEILATHKVLTGPRAQPSAFPQGHDVVQISHTQRQTTVLVRTTEPILDPRWIVSPIGLEDVVLAYMSTASSSRAARQLVEVPA